MKIVLTFHETADASVVAALGGTVIDEVEFIPRIMIADIPETSLPLLSIHPAICHYQIDEGMSPPPDVVHANYKAEQSAFAYQLNAIRVADYWERGLTGKGVKIAVIDTGGGTHYAVDLAGGYDSNPHPTLPLDWSRDDSTTTNNLGHGTRTVGTVCAKPYQGTTGMVAGPAFDAEVYVVKFFGSGSPWYHRRVDAINWCIENKINIISMSISWTVGTPELEGVLIKAARDAGILVVCSAGNAPSLILEDEYPQCSPDAVVIGGVDANLRRHNYNFGPTLTFLGPSRGIEATVYKAGGISSATATANGTSFAAPLVAGVLALYMQAFPHLSSEEILEMAKRGARKIEGKTGWDERYGWGLIAPSKEILALPRVSKRRGLRFYGNGDYIDCGKAESLNIKDQLTLVVEMNQELRSTGHLFAKASSTGNNIYYGMLLGSDGIYPEYRTGSTQVKPKYPRSLSDGQDHTVAFVYDYPVIRMYVDGKPMKEEITMTGPMSLSTAADRLYLGSNQGASTGSFTGLLYKAKVYNRALTTEEIVSDYEGQLQVDGLQLYYEFTGGEVSEVPDLSGLANHGTIEGTSINLKTVRKLPSTSGPAAMVKPVTNLAISSKTDHSITLSWTSVGVPGATYQVYDVNQSNPLANGITATSYTISNIPANTSYIYKVIVSDVFGNISAAETVTGVTDRDITAPGNLTGLGSGMITPTTATFFWTETSVVDHDAYEVYRGAAGSAFAAAELLDSNVSVPLYHASDLTPSTNYRFWVLSRDKDGNRSATPAQHNLTTIATSTVLYQDSFDNRTSDTTLGMPQIGTSYKYIGSVPYGTKDGYAYAVIDGGWLNPAYVDVDASNFVAELEFKELGLYSPSLYVRLGTNFQNSIFFAPSPTNSDRGEFYGRAWRFSKYLGGRVGTMTGISESTLQCENGDRVRIESSSNGRITAIVNGKAICSITDNSFLTGPFKVGLGAPDTLTKFDNFKVEVL